MNTHTTQGFERYGTYQTKRTGILLVDPYNDFVHPDGKAYGRSKEVIEAVHMFENMKQIISMAREKEIKVFFVPHHRSEANDYLGWKYPTAGQLSTRDRQLFAKDTW